MNISVLTNWVEIEMIQYLIIATVILGLIMCIKWLILGR